ncbi:hypothetical protein RvY_06579 [Ramazzottius varieornatus]|uniref:Uncharacterized protein n=1 Tax=Ramazzottius varieornatus TaxID=947166 RepID=A0A1D1V2H7_RAMVA|nr:hypothetical protein RvY_06579 [Ramazzottius varieornatus]
MATRTPKCGTPWTSFEENLWVLIRSKRSRPLPNLDRTTPLCRRSPSPTLTALRSGSLVSTLMSATGAKSSTAVTSMEI